MNISKQIEKGLCILGIEFGSTRIKAILIDNNNKVIEVGNYNWENKLVDGVWTYDLDLVMVGLKESYASLSKRVLDNHHVVIKKVKAIGISAMMHGYIVLDKNDKQLAPFRTWRNTITGEAADELTELFKINIPQRWSIAHLYQSILTKDKHVKDIDCLSTLSGYIHYKLTGEKVLGIDDASGMFPIDIKTKSYNEDMLSKFNNLVSKEGYNWKVEEILPKVLVAGEKAGSLSKEGALLIDPTGKLESNIPMCPPEGDAGTGMIATNSITINSGNVSAGTSIFTMIVLDKQLEKLHREIDIVTTPDGKQVAMVHANNCTSEYDSWISIFKEVIKATGNKVKTSDLYDVVLNESLKANANCGNIVAYNFLSGEHVFELENGRPMIVKNGNTNFNLANFMRAELNASVCSLRKGIDILKKDEGIEIKILKGHGGFFKTKDVGQIIMSSALDCPVAILSSAGEGGAYGISLLASYMVSKEEKETLDDFLNNRVFESEKLYTIEATDKDKTIFNNFYKNYIKCFEAQRKASELFN